MPFPACLSGFLYIHRTGDELKENIRNINETKHKQEKRKIVEFSHFR